MTQSQLLTPITAAPRPADRCCDRQPCFQARLEATTGLQQIHAITELCARHLGDAVQDLATWARREGLHGELTILAVGPPAPRHQAANSGTQDGQLPTSFAFSTIQLDP